MNCWAGVDLGGTNVVCGLLNDSGKLIAIEKADTEADKGFLHVIGIIEQLVHKVLEYKGISMAELKGVGIGVPGFVNPNTGVSNLATNLGWENQPVAFELNRRLGVPVFADNDVRMYTYGESIAGAGKGFEHVLCITVGTGVAAAYINQGRFLYGSSFYAGEIGHIPIPGIKQRCKCGMIGCLETYVSAPGMVKQAKAFIKKGYASVLEEGQVEIMSALDISDAYDNGDLVAHMVFRQTAKWLAMALASTIPVLCPDTVIIGGGVAKAGERLMNPLRMELVNRLHPGYIEKIVFNTAHWNEEAGVIGSAMFARSLVEVS